MPLDGPETAANGRKPQMGIWVAPGGRTALNVDLRGAQIWMSLKPLATNADLEYIRAIAEGLGYTCTVTYRVVRAAMEFDLDY